MSSETIVKTWENEHNNYIQPIDECIYSILRPTSNNVRITTKARHICLDIINLHTYIELLNDEKVASTVELCYSENTPFDKNKIEYTLELFYYSHKVTKDNMIAIQQCTIVAELATHLQEIEDCINKQDKSRFIEASIEVQRFYNEERQKEYELAKKLYKMQ